MITICSWCTANDESAAIGRAGTIDNDAVTYGICETHAQQLFEELEQTKSEPVP